MAPRSTAALPAPDCGDGRTPRGAPGAAWLTRGALCALLVLVGASALACGWTLVSRPDGSGIGLPLALLSETPFRSFLVPGLLLGLAVGGSAMAAALLVARRARVAPWAALAAGAILVGWIAIQAALIGFFWLQPVLLAVGVLQLHLGRRLLRARSRG